MAKTAKIVKAEIKSTNRLDNPQHKDLKVWHIPQIPLRDGVKPFEVPVRSVVEGKFLMDVLSQYDMYQLATNIKPDFSNACGLMIYDAGEGEWNDWYDDEGNDLSQSELAEDVDDDKTEALRVMNKEQVDDAIAAEMAYRKALKEGLLVPSWSANATKSRNSSIKRDQNALLRQD
jgi:hypothetical protein